MKKLNLPIVYEIKNHFVGQATTRLEIIVTCY